MRKTAKTKKVRQARKLPVDCGGCCNHDDLIDVLDDAAWAKARPDLFGPEAIAAREAAAIAEAVARAFPGLSVSVETISEAEAKRRLAEGGNLFRGGLL
jgi:hypothetical protein